MTAAWKMIQRALNVRVARYINVNRKRKKVVSHSDLRTVHGIAVARLALGVEASVQGSETPPPAPQDRVPNSQAPALHDMLHLIMNSVAKAKDIACPPSQRERSLWREDRVLTL